MKEICVGKGGVIREILTFELFRYKTKSSCVYNKTEEKKRRLCNFIVCEWDDDSLGMLIVL